MAFKEYDPSVMMEAKRLRLLGLSMGEVAKNLAVAKSTISRWFNGLATPGKHGGKHIITDELRQKYREAAIKGNKSRIYQRKPVNELKSIHRIRDRIFKDRGRRCERCGWARDHPKTGTAPVQLHHKDGDRNNNIPSNLEVLCPNCHSLTEDYMFFGKNHKGTWGTKGTIRYR